MKPKLVITGGSGFVGSAIARAAKDYDAVVFDRQPPEPSLSCQYIQGDILSPKQLYQALFNADIVIHAAANPNLWHPNRDLLMNVNYHGTLNVLKACQNLKVRKLIFISSDCTLTSSSQTIMTESSKTTLDDMIGTYCKSKWLAEQAVLAANGELQTLSINPGVPIGATKQNAPFVQMIEAFSQGQIKAILKGHIGMIDVEDIAKLCMLAIDKGISGQRYLAVSEVWSLDQLFGFLGKQLQIEAPTWHVPYWLANMGANFQAFGAYFTNKPPLATKAGIHLARYTRQIDNAKTKQALGIEFNAIEPALIAMIKGLNDLSQA